MPELPEVETVRRGLQEAIAGRRIERVDVLGRRTVRRQQEGPEAFAEPLAGSTVLQVRRRGKYLWWVLDDQRRVLAAHLGMSGQFRLVSPGAEPMGPHERVRFTFEAGPALSFIDQRTFGWLLVDEPVDGVPRSAAHIAQDPFEPGYDLERTARSLRKRRTGVKRALLGQHVVSGIGNIYADEALWRARMHPEQATDQLAQRRAREVLLAASEVMAEALAVGGTSFDPLYVNVNGESGWFARRLSAYGRSGQPCLRCGRPIVREAFANRSSYRCPRCQRLPARRR